MIEGTVDRVKRREDFPQLPNDFGHVAIVDAGTAAFRIRRHDDTGHGTTASQCFKLLRDVIEAG